MSNKLSISEKQKIWDRLLIEGWFKERRLWMVIDEYGEKTGAPKTKRGYFLPDLSGMERVPHENLVGKATVRNFIESGNELLSRVLWAGKETPESVIAVIGSFKFVDNKKRIIKRRNEKQNLKRAERSSRTVRARSLDKKHEWGTVK